MSSSFNGIKVQLPAFYLRSLGYSVLVPNMRDHGSSSNTSHGKISWAMEYPYDVLGAWDYVLSDPDGHLGGKRDPKIVGLQAGSMGGLASAAAFGMEERIAGLWLNGAVFDPRDLIGNAVGFLGAAAPAIYKPAWAVMEASVGLKLREHVPVVEMPEAPKLKRPVALIQGKQDSAVPQSAVDGYKNLVDNSNGRYELKEEWYPEGVCNKDIHVLEAVKWPQEYADKLCKFWNPILLGKPCTKKLLAHENNLLES